MTTAPTTDVIDHVLGLDPSSPLATLRNERAKLKQLTQTSYEAALRPKDAKAFRVSGGRR